MTGNRKDGAHVLKVRCNHKMSLLFNQDQPPLAVIWTQSRPVLHVPPEREYLAKAIPLTHQVDACPAFLMTKAAGTRPAH